MDEWNVTPNMRTLEKLEMTPNTKIINQELNGYNPNMKMQNLEMQDLSMLIKDMTPDIKEDD